MNRLQPLVQQLTSASLTPGATPATLGQGTIERRDGHWLAMQVEDSKIALTAQDARPIDLGRVEPGLVAELTRELFEGAIEPLLERVRASVTQLLGDAGVGVEQVDTVFFTGGSCGIPALRQSVAR